MATNRRGKAAEAEKETKERWLLTYADLITLLLAFFILLYATTRQEIPKIPPALVAQLVKAFSIGVLQGNEPQAVFNTGNIPTIIGGLSGVGATIGRELISYAQKEQLGDQVSVEASDEWVVITLAGSLVFSSGDEVLRPEGKQALDQIAQYLRTLPNPIRVEGHTDNISPASDGKYASNWELSAARAVAVARYLIEAGDIPARRVTAAAYGEQLPIADNSTPEGRRRNRRTEIWVLPEDHSDARRRARS